MVEERTTTLLLTDGHALVCNGLARLLTTYGGLEVVGATTNDEGAVTQELMHDFLRLGASRDVLNSASSRQLVSAARAAVYPRIASPVLYRDLGGRSSTRRINRIHPRKALLYLLLGWFLHRRVGVDGGDTGGGGSPSLHPPC